MIMNVSGFLRTLHPVRGDICQGKRTKSHDHHFKGSSAKVFRRPGSAEDSEICRKKGQNPLRRRGGMPMTELRSRTPTWSRGETFVRSPGFPDTIFRPPTLTVFHG